eukprot:GEMP01007711.1.p1 GENE.GEMP01007711.1~~GEMP01007711.1.p1  ORF type:complete len:859 (+),score=243.87 GEMP01007711.1:532-3108(+)
MLFFQGAVMDHHKPVLRAPAAETPRTQMFESLRWHVPSIFKLHAKTPRADSATAEVKAHKGNAATTRALAPKTDTATAEVSAKTLKPDSGATRGMAPKMDTTKAKPRQPLCKPLAKPVLDCAEVALTKYCAALFPTMGHQTERNLGCIFRSDANSAVVDGQHEKASWEQRVRAARDAALVAHKNWMRRKRQMYNKRDLAMPRSNGGKLKHPLHIIPSPVGATITGRLTFGMAAPSSKDDEPSNLGDFVRAENNLAQRAKRRTSLDESILSPTSRFPRDTLSKQIGKLGMLNDLGDDFFMQRLQEAYQKPYGGIKCEQSLEERVRILKVRQKMRREKRLTDVNRVAQDAAEEEKKRVRGTFQDDYRRRLRSVFNGARNEDGEELDDAQDMTNTMTRQDVRRALMQLKLWPKTAEEKYVYDEVVAKRAFKGGGGVDDGTASRRITGNIGRLDEDDDHGGVLQKITFEQFLALVQTLKKEIGVCRRARAQELFEDFHEDGAKFLTEEAIFQIADLMILQPSKSLYLGTEEALHKVRACIRELMTTYGHEVDCEAFFVLYAELETCVHMLKFVKSDELSAAFHLHPRVAHEYRADLCDLKCMFDQCDEDRSRFLSTGEILLLVSDLGVACTTRHERIQLEQMFREADVDGSGELDFTEFLIFLTQVREQIAETNCMQYNALFYIFDRDESGSLSYREAAMCLGHLGLHPRTKDEQVEFTLALEEQCDEETNTLSEANFPTYVHNIREIIIRNERKTHMVYAKELGFTVTEARRLRVAFDRLFAPAEEIGLTELEHLMVCLQKKIDPVELRRLFKDHDKNDDHKIDFSEFLALMKTLNRVGREDSFGANSQTSPRETILHWCE